ncbi:MAG TPA: glycosyltransferase family 39 protein [Pirellulaceae bacterium]|nr:glycosyltransferase family 39 protein [Pirellulaceae bacterium]
MSRSKRRSPNRVSSPPAQSAATTPLSPDSPSARELLLVAILLVLGVGLRVAFPSRMAIEHFDEGVYASNIWFGPEVGYQYPMRRFYAPPLLPALIEWSLIFDRMRDPSPDKFSSLASMVPSLLAGCLTLLVVWKMAREWFGPETGLATLAIASLSDFHALYSRAALTEALLLLFLVAAVWMLKRAFSTGSYLALGLAGLFTGLCWWTKYNGWLPLAIGFGGLTIAFMVDTRCRRQYVRLTALWLGAAAIAFAVWSPYLRELQSYGGYAEVAANHRQYLVGFGGWMTSLSRQYANLSHFDGWPTCASVGIAVLLIGSVARPDRRPLIKLFALAIGLCAAIAWLGAALVMFFLATWVIGTELYRRWLNSAAEGERDYLALYFLAAWIGGLLMTTPLYHPYPRLALPWLYAVWIGAGFSISRLVEAAGGQFELQRASKQWAAMLVVCVLVLSLGLPRVAERGVPAWQARTGWLPISKQIIAEFGHRAEVARGNRDETVVLVYGEPGLFFQLNVDGTQVFEPAADLSFLARPPQDPSIPIFLVTGPHAERTSGFQEDLAQNAAYLERIAGYEYLPSDFVLLDQYDPRSLAKVPGSARTEKVTLYKVVHGRTRE